MELGSLLYLICSFLFGSLSVSDILFRFLFYFFMFLMGKIAFLFPSFFRLQSELMALMVRRILVT